MTIYFEEELNLKSSFIHGVLSVFGFQERRIDYIKKQLQDRKDHEAIKEDWMTIGNDLQKSFNKLKEEEETHAQ